MKMLNDPMVMKLIETFDLKTPDECTLRICDYEFINNKILINKIQVLDKNGKILRFADLEKVVPYLSKYYTIFGDRTTNTIKVN